MEAHANWGWLALLGLGLALVMGGDRPIPDHLALLRTLHPQAQQRFLALFLALEALGFRVELTSAKRAGTSDFHGFGLACDFNVVHLASGRRYGSVALGAGNDKVAWETTGIPALIRQHGFRWGGDFTTPWMFNGKLHPAYDPVHVDLGNVYAISRLRAAALRLAGSPAGLVNYDARKVPLSA